MIKLIKTIKGQIGLGFLISSLGLLGGLGGVIITKFYRVDDKVEVVQTRISEVEIKTAVLEEAISSIKKSNEEIKSDLKELIRLNTRK